MKNFIERLIICWYVLTKKNYIYFGIGKNPILWDKNGKYENLKDGELQLYTYFDDYTFMTKNGKSNLHDMVWDTVKDVADEALKGEF